MEIIIVASKSRIASGVENVMMACQIKTLVGFSFSISQASSLLAGGAHCVQQEYSVGDYFMKYVRITIRILGHFSSCTIDLHDCSGKISFWWLLKPLRLHFTHCLYKAISSSGKNSSFLFLLHPTFLLHLCTCCGILYYIHS